MNPLQYNPRRIRSQGELMAQAATLDRVRQGNALQRMEMEAMQQQQAAQAQQRNALQRQQGMAAGYLDATSDANGPAMPFDPAQALNQGVPLELVKYLQEQRNPKPAPMMNVSPGGAVFDPQTQKPVFTAPFKPDTPAVPQIAQLQAVRDSLPAGDPRRREVQAVIDNQTRAPKYASAPGPAGGTAPSPSATVAPKPSAAAEKVEIDRAKSGRQSEQMLSAIDKARSLLAQDPTDSGIGAGMDWLGRQFGVSTESAQTAAQLETLSGWMVANVPRMEGPQSNFDVENYKTMAAKVGDRSVPIPERLAALTTLEALHRKYAEINGTPLPPGPSTAVDTSVGVPPVFTDPAKQRRYEAWKAQQP